jgi:hypothetical protein
MRDVVSKGASVESISTNLRIVLIIEGPSGPGDTEAFQNKKKGLTKERINPFFFLKSLKKKG